MRQEAEVLSLSSSPNKKLFLPIDENGREIFIYNIQDALFPQDKTFYPDLVVYSLSEKTAYDPLEEVVMSLVADVRHGTSNKPPKLLHGDNKDNRYQRGDYYFFVYNTENYYHFLYDSLPYLLGFLEAKASKPELKILINFPNQKSNTTYRFFDELIELIGIRKHDLVFLEPNTVYENLYICSSLTYGNNPNASPRSEIYNIYRRLSDMVKIPVCTLPKKIYISRRSWIHNDYSNIGTNYTNRRVMQNENELVSALTSKGYTEVFAESLDTVQKIQLFNNATNIVGAIGGGLANVLFSAKDTKLTCVVSPVFLEINSRFTFSFKNVDVRYCVNSAHTESGVFKRSMRVRFLDGLVGEICDIHNDELDIVYSEQNVAGWNSQIEYKHIILPKKEVQIIDDGLNSNWKCDISEVLENCQ